MVGERRRPPVQEPAQLAVITVDGLPRRPVIVAQLLRELAEHHIPIEGMSIGRHRYNEELVLAVDAARADEALAVAVRLADRFGVGPVRADATWHEVTIDAGAGRPGADTLAEVLERLAGDGLETWMVHATPTGVSCLVRSISGR